jgi:hypothetical protein
MHYKFITLLHYFVNALIAKVLYIMLLMVWDIIPVGSIPNKQRRPTNEKNFEVNSFEIYNPAARNLKHKRKRSLV